MLKRLLVLRCGATVIAIIATATAFMLGMTASAQTTLRVVKAEEAAQHLRAPVSVTYPKLAQAARVDGRVHLLVEVSEAGRVKAVQVLTSVPMLDQASIDAVSGAVFTPFSDGSRPVSVLLDVVVSFQSDSVVGSGRTVVTFDDALWRASQLLVQCEAAAGDAPGGQAVGPCERAVDAARQIGSAASASQVRAAWLLGRARLSSGAAAEAATALESAVAVAATDRASGRTAPADLLLDAARARRASGDLKKSLDWYDRAKKLMQAQLNRPSPDHEAQLSRLRVLIAEYSEALLQAGNAKGAQRMAEDLAKLK